MTLDCYEKFNEVIRIIGDPSCIILYISNSVQLFENEKYEEAALYAATSFKVTPTTY